MIGQLAFAPRITVLFSSTPVNETALGTGIMGVAGKLEA